MPGRPLRFLGVLGSAWIGGRVFMLWPAAEEILKEVTLPRLPAALAAAPMTTMPPAQIWTRPPMRPAFAPHRVPGGQPSLPGSMSDSQILASVGMFYFTEVPPAGAAAAMAPIGSAAPTPDLPLWPAQGPSVGSKRWSLDAWTLVRDGRGGGPFAPQLGGSQAGIRLGYFIDARHRTAAYVRVTTAIERPDVEAATGIQWQPTALPVAAFAEARRRANGSVAPVAGLVGGVYRAPIAERWRLDGYGQAGVIGVRRPEGFADGQARVTRPAGAIGPAALEAGIGAWGGIQRDAARFDLGPTLGVELPVRSGNLRLTLDWRQRIAGHATPASGPALTLAAGF